jgi:hypothetical protein
MPIEFGLARNCREKDPEGGLEKLKGIAVAYHREKAEPISLNLQAEGISTIMENGNDSAGCLAKSPPMQCSLAAHARLYIRHDDFRPYHRAGLPTEVPGTFQGTRNVGPVL